MIPEDGLRPICQTSSYHRINSDADVSSAPLSDPARSGGVPFTLPSHLPNKPFGPSRSKATSAASSIPRTTARPGGRAAQQQRTPARAREIGDWWPLPPPSARAASVEEETKKEWYICKLFLKA